MEVGDARQKQAVGEDFEAARGLGPCSQTRWIFVLSPLRECPRAWSVGLGEYPARRLAPQVPILRATAACWCARQTVESTFTSHVIDQSGRVGAGLDARAWSCSRSRAQVPSRCRRRSKLYADSHDPYRSGMSRHGVPARVRHRIALIWSRPVDSVGQPRLCAADNGGSGTVH